MGDEIQGVFVLWAVGKGIHRALSRMRKFLQAPLEEDDQLAFPRGWGAIEEEDTTSHIGAERSRLKIFHHFGQGLVDAEEIVFKKTVMLLASLIDTHARSVNHAIEPCMCPLGQRGLR